MIIEISKISTYEKKPTNSKSKSNSSSFFTTEICSIFFSSIILFHFQTSRLVAMAIKFKLFAHPLHYFIMSALFCEIQRIFRRLIFFMIILLWWREFCQLDLCHVIITYSRSPFKETSDTDCFVRTLPLFGGVLLYIILYYFTRMK